PRLRHDPRGRRGGESRARWNAVRVLLGRHAPGLDAAGLDGRDRARPLQRDLLPDGLHGESGERGGVVCREGDPAMPTRLAAVVALAVLLGAPRTTAAAPDGGATFASQNWSLGATTTFWCGHRSDTSTSGCSGTQTANGNFIVTTEALTDCTVSVSLQTAPEN